MGKETFGTKYGVPTLLIEVIVYLAMTFLAAQTDPPLMSRGTLHQCKSHHWPGQLAMVELTTGAQHPLSQEGPNMETDVRRMRHYQESNLTMASLTSSGVTLRVRNLLRWIIAI